MVIALNIIHCFLIARICDFCILHFHYLCPTVSQQFCVPLRDNEAEHNPAGNKAGQLAADERTTDYW
jgi:hypothetical protein